MPIGTYILGFLLASIALGPIVGAAIRVRVHALPRWEGAPARVAETVAAVGLLVISLQLAGVVGALDRLGICVACALIAALTWFLVERLSRQRGEPATARRAQSVGVAANTLALLAVALTAAAWLSWVVSSYRTGMEGVDTLWYHLPFAARFVQTGSILHLHYVDRDPVTVFYPANSSLLHAFGLVMFRSDVLSPLINLGWAALALAAGWSIGRPYGRGPHCLIAVVLVLATPGLIDTQPGGGYDDIVGVALLLAAMALLVNGGLSPPVTAMAAAAAGVALGTKYQFVIPALALGLGVVALSRGRRWRHAAIWAGGLVVFGGYWYLRNAVIVGNPVPSLAHLGPLTLPSPRVTTPSFAVGEYLFNGTIWKAFFLPGFRNSLGRAWWVVIALALAGAFVTPWVDRDPIRRMLAVVAAVGLVAFVLTPQFLGLPGLPLFFGDNVRYLAAPLAMGVVLVPASRLLRGAALSNAWLAIGAAALVATAIDRRVWQTDFTGLPSVGDRGTGSVLAGALIGGGIVLLPWLNGRVRAALRSPRRRTTVIASAAAALCALGACGWLVADSYADRRFAATPPLPRIYAWAQHLRGARIGIVGLDEQYPLYGADASNFVQFVGKPQPHSGFGTITTCRVWRVMVNRGHYGWLVLTPFGFPINLTVPIAPEATWTLSSPSAKRVIVERAQVGVGAAILVRLTGPLDPGAC
jgi:hypothetical protein